MTSPADNINLVEDLKNVPTDKDEVIDEENPISFDDSLESEEAELDDAEGIEDIPETYIVSSKVLRNVYVYKEFDEKIREEIKISEDAESVKNRIILKLMTLDTETLNLFIKSSKHSVPVHCKNGMNLYRKRSPKGSNINKINRYVLCYGSAIKHPDIKDEDIILLSYLGADMHDKAQYKEYIDKVAGYVSHAGIEDFERNADYTAERAADNQGNSNFDIVYRAVLQSDQRSVKYIPMLDTYQTDILEERLVTPPRVVYGSAGTGKTLLSEELYERWSKEHPQDKILYLTYMPRLMKSVRQHLLNRGLNRDRINVKDINSLVCETVPQLRSKKYNLQTEEDFSNWVRDNEKKKSFKLKAISQDKDIAISTAYVFFRTFANYEALKSEKNFYQEIKNEVGLEDSQKKAIFTICSAYEKHLSTNNVITDNKAASEVEKVNLHAYDAIIVDEIQDLTRAQVQCIRSLLKDRNRQPNQNIFAFGDDNQTINPTLLRMSEAEETILQQYGKHRDKHDAIVLSGSYRSTDYLIRYINYINSIRSRVIGKDKDFNDQEQISKISAVNGNESDKPVFITDGGILNTGLNSPDILGMNDVMIIVPNKEEYEKVKKEHPGLVGKNDYTNLLTIEETKGGEWDTVILYNFFSSAADVWSKFVEIFDDRNASSLKSTIHRMYFNRFYVGLTRASNKVIIAEPDGLNPDIERVFLPTAIKSQGKTTSVFRKIESESEFTAFFKNDYSHDVWFAKAEEKASIEDFEMAFDYIAKAKRALEGSEVTDKEKYRKKYNNADQKYRIRAWLAENEKLKDNNEDVQMYLDLSFDCDDGESIREIYERTNQKKKKELFDEKIGDPVSAYIDKVKTSQRELSFTPEETKYYDIRLLKAYKKLISDEMKGM